MLLACAFLGLYAFSNRTVLGQTIENSWARQYDDVTPGLWLDGTRWFPPFHFDVATAVVGTLLAVALAGAQRRWRDLAVVASATPAVLVAGAVFKHVAGRPRLVQSLDFDVSYPSGHAGIALAVTAALLTAAPRRHLRWLAPLTVGWCVLVVGGLQAEGQHRASEVIGSGLLTAAVFLAAGAVLVPAGRRTRFHALWTRSDRILVPIGLLVALVVGSWTPVPWMTAAYACATALAVALVLGAVVESGSSESVL